MKLLMLFSGLPGVGKTTISSQVASILGAEVVDIDDFKKTDVDPNLVTSQIDPPELRWSYYKKALGHVFGRFDQGISIAIMDEVFHLHSLRMQIEHLCSERLVSVLWVEVVCSYEVVSERLLSAPRQGHILSSEEALRMYVMFEEIFEKFARGSANHVVLHNEDVRNVDTLVEEILKRVT